jgi:hypothetical protein
MRDMLLRLIACGFSLFLAGGAYGQTDELVTVAIARYTISGMVTRLDGIKAFKSGIVLFPGHPGIVRLRQDSGELQYEQRGNFLIRSRRHWLDDETLTLVIDAPSDEWAQFTQRFRETPRYGADVKALLEEVSRRYGVEDWTLIGTSEGSVSAFHAARMNPQLARRVILSSSFWGPTRVGPGLSGARWSELRAALLWVHHEDDPCEHTAYREARRYAAKSAAPLVTVRGGGPGRGGACMAFSAHGYVGIEREVVFAMRSWVKTGTVPPDVEEKTRSEED